MIDHISVGVSNLERSIAFYEKALAPLHYAKVMVFEGAAGFGTAGHPAFWLGLDRRRQNVIGPGFHVAFKAPDRAAVDAFHKVAIEAGGTDNGPPGLRPQYHSDYYAAFVIDPDGHHLEAVCHHP